MNVYLILLAHIMFALTKMFSTYEPVQNGGLVRMGSNTPCEVIGIVSVKIKTHYGMTRTLTDVRHIPTIFRNFISLSTLDNMGYSYFA
jgi:hypothetical protein